MERDVNLILQLLREQSKAFTKNIELQKKSFAEYQDRMGKMIYELNKKGNGKK